MISLTQFNRFALIGVCCLGLVGSAQAVIVAFEAESGTLGSQFDPAISDAGASGGFYITTETDNGGTNPGTDAFTASYTFDLAAGTYDVYVRATATTSGAVGGNDSFYWATSFGDADPAVDGDWNLENGFTGFMADNTAGVFGWSIALGTITSSGGSVTWEIGAREDGFWMDAFAFATAGTDVGRDASGQSTTLDNALIPEPSAAMLLLGSGLVLLLRRRR